jgi:thioredoxin-related protein
METGTFPEERVADSIGKHFVPLKYESGRDAEQFLRFGVSATPTFVFLNAQGDEVHRLVGYATPDDFIKQLDRAGKNARKN